MFNGAPGFGGQILWRPNANVSFTSNNYYGHDWLNLPDRWRLHTDNSIQVKYYDDSTKTFDRGAFSLTVDAGCEKGNGVSCTGGTDPQQSFLGFMLYNRSWFAKNLYGLTLGVGAMNNPGRYLVLLPPINGATAFSGTPYFTQNPGDKFKAWDASITFDYMPDQYTTFRLEGIHRESNVPYFAGPGGVTPVGGNQGLSGSFVEGFFPDLRKTETRMLLSILVKL
jgi:hypothetical protein